MAIPVPAYLSTLAYCEKAVNKNEIRIGIKCPCGCSKFLLHESKERSNAAELEEWYRKEKSNRGIFRRGKIDCSNMPEYENRKAFKVICPECDAEYVLYDNSKHGYNRCFPDNKKSEDNEPLEYMPVKMKKNSDEPIEIKLSIMNDETYERFLGGTGEDWDFDVYSNSFSSIYIYAFINNKDVELYCEDEID